VSLTRIGLARSATRSSQESDCSSVLMRVTGYAMRVTGYGIRVAGCLRNAQRVSRIPYRELLRIREGVNGPRFKRLARLEDDRGEVLVMHRVGEVLRLQAAGAAVSVGLAAFAFLPLEEVPRVELHARLG